jgi:hypothetical protein
MSFYLEKDYFEDPELFNLVTEVMQGHLTLHWWDARTERVRAVPKDPRRGLTYEDTNIGSYGYDSLPEVLRNRYSMAARGSEIAGRLPDLGYTINRKSDVWSDNVAALYEEAKSRRWAPAIDVPWAKLAEAPLPPALEAAVAQLMTTLEEIALVGLEMPSRWVYGINQEFLELKSFLCAQMIDQARHVEVFRKRGLAGGQGLKRASVAVEQALKEILFAGTYPEGSASMNLMLGSVLLTLYRFAAAIAPSLVEQRLFRLAIQDKARHVAYGMGHVRYHLAHQPRQKEFLQDYLDRTEHCIFGILGSSEVVGALTIMAGGGIDPEALGAGRRRVARFLERAIGEYLERRERLGLGDPSRENRMRSTLREVLA